MVSRVAAVGMRRNATANTASAFLDDLLERYPIRIRAIQVDGGSEFMGEFEEACANSDISTYVLPPRSPKLNGRVELFNRTSREEFWQRYDGDFALDELGPALRAWEDEYNRVRPHQALQVRTPLEYLAQLTRGTLSHMS